MHNDIGATGGNYNNFNEGTRKMVLWLSKKEKERRDEEGEEKEKERRDDDRDDE
jgi:hypothetical protein